MCLQVGSRKKGSRKTWNTVANIPTMSWRTTHLLKQQDEEQTNSCTKYTLTLFDIFLFNIKCKKKTYICFLKTSDVKEGAIQDQDDWQGSALSERIMCPVINQYEHPYNLAWSEDTHCYVAGQTLTSNKLHSQQLE